VLCEAVCLQIAIGESFLLPPKSVTFRLLWFELAISARDKNSGNLAKAQICGEKLPTFCGEKIR
jgi:hypothetical protein